MADVSDLRITVSDEDFQAALSQFNTCKSNFEIAYLQEKVAMLTLDSSWNGDASEAYAAQFNKLLANLETSDQTMEKAIGDIQFALSQYGSADAAASSAYSSMEDTTDPFSEG